MKLLTIALIISTTLFTQSSHAQILKIASDASYPPFSYIDSNNELKGFDIDISYALCKKMNVECSIITQDFEGMIPGLLAKNTMLLFLLLLPQRSACKRLTSQILTIIQHSL